MKNTRIVYEYREENGLYKQEVLIVAGTLTLSQIADSLNDQFFIPNQVGLDDLQLRFDPAILSAHLRVWHRMVSMEPTEEAPTVALTAAQLHARFQDVIWDGDKALQELREYIRDEENLLGDPSQPSGKIIYLKRVKSQVPWDRHAWPVHVVRDDTVMWYGQSIHHGSLGSPRPYSKLDWSQVLPPLTRCIVLNFAGALTEQIWSELFAGWERFSILPDLHHLLIDSEFRLADERRVHELIALFLEHIAPMHHWEERNWGKYADAVLVLYPEEDPLRTFLRRSLEKVFGKALLDARADLAHRSGEPA